jgi:hypothetical protein
MIRAAIGAANVARTANNLADRREHDPNHPVPWRFQQFSAFLPQDLIMKGR